MRFFFFNDTATTEIYTLSLHDALPISDDLLLGGGLEADVQKAGAGDLDGIDRSEEHTSELQSQSNIVCRLLLEKKIQTCSLHISQLDPCLPDRSTRVCCSTGSVHNNSL